nr:unnamed protein product [Digitaria exilis]
MGPNVPAGPRIYHLTLSRSCLSTRRRLVDRTRKSWSVRLHGGTGCWPRFDSFVALLSSSWLLTSVPFLSTTPRRARLSVSRAATEDVGVARKVKAYPSTHSPPSGKDHGCTDPANNCARGAHARYAFASPNPEPFRRPGGGEKDEAKTIARRPQERHLGGRDHRLLLLLLLLIAGVPVVFGYADSPGSVDFVLFRSTISGSRVWVVGLRVVLCFAIDCLLLVGDVEICRSAESGVVVMILQTDPCLVELEVDRWWGILSVVGSDDQDGEF